MFNIGYKDFCSIFFYNEEEIWIIVFIGDLKCFSIVGKCMKIIIIKLNLILSDIVVIRDGDLLYCDFNVKILNKKSDGKNEEIIKLQGWIFISLCVIFIGDVVVSMYNDDSI